MRRRALAAASVLASAGALVAVGSAVGATDKVFVGDNFLEPAKMKIEKGDRLAFEWIGSEEHELAKSKGPGKFFHSGPYGGDGVALRHRFEKRGTYQVICTLHERMRMKIEVR